jgi:predicted secreted protein
MPYFSLLIFLLSLQSSFASRQQFFDVIGSSSKGQFVALEEYGYHPDRNVFYVQIKIMNVWKKEYVGTPTMVEVSAQGGRIELARAREKAKLLAQEDLKKFNVL